MTRPIRLFHLDHQVTNLQFNIAYFSQYRKPQIMDSVSQRAEALKLQIASTETQLANLKAQLASIEEPNSHNPPSPATENLTIQSQTKSKWPLTSEEYQRYGRQMIVPKIGIQGLFPHPILHLAHSSLPFQSTNS